MTEQANQLLELMRKASEAVKSERWDDAEHLLNGLAQSVQTLRLAIRDKRLPIAAPQILRDDEVIG